ncbi:MAG: hypothetical protein IT221_04815, partial [Fluviicola sp.]|nr:hypothetical protein [Fluviicola sp.]
MKYLLIYFFLACSSFVFAQGPKDTIQTTTTIGGTLEFDYAKALKYTLGPIRV